MQGMLRKHLSPLRFPMTSQKKNKLVQELDTSDRNGSEITFRQFCKDLASLPRTAPDAVKSEFIMDNIDRLLQVPAVYPLGHMSDSRRSE